MRIGVLLYAGVAGLLAACSPPADAPADGGAGGAGATVSSIQPGQYRTTVTMLEMNIPGAPSQAINMAPSTSEECVTATDISELTRDSMVDAGEGETCTQNSMNAAGGRIEGEATCQGEYGTRTMHMSGTYNSTHVEMEIAATASIPGVGDTSQRMRIVTERIGECAANADAE